MMRDASAQAAPSFRPNVRLRSAARVLASVLAVVMGGASRQPARGQDLAHRNGAPSTAADFAPELADAARQFGVSTDWLRAIMHAESDGDAAARSPKGAIGLMQLMPGTYADMQRTLGLGRDPWRPADNLLAGAGYLRSLIDRYGATGAVAAYNAGPGRYERWLAGTASLPAETRAYVARVRSSVGGAASSRSAVATRLPKRSAEEAPLFVGSVTLSASPEDQASSIRSEDRPRPEARSGDAVHSASTTSESRLFVPVQALAAQP